MILSASLYIQSLIVYLIEHTLLNLQVIYEYMNENRKLNKNEVNNEVNIDIEHSDNFYIISSVQTYKHTLSTPFKFWVGFIKIYRNMPTFIL